MSEVKTQFAEVAGRRIAHRHTAGSGPALVFLPGYMSDMAGSKAAALFDWCVAAGRECLLLDYSGCGESSGDFADGTLSRWCEEVTSLVEARVANKRIVLIGSSMGGWLMLLAAQQLSDRLAGIVGIAAAPDFTSWGYNAQQKSGLASGQTIYEDNPYGPEPTPTHPDFWTDGEAQLQLTGLQLTGEIPITCAVRLLHGQNDNDVPPDISIRLAAALRSEDVQVTLVKGGDHRLSRESDIALLLRTIASIH